MHKLLPAAIKPGITQKYGAGQSPEVVVLGKRELCYHVVFPGQPLLVTDLPTSLNSTARGLFVVALFNLYSSKVN